MTNKTTPRFRHPIEQPGDSTALCFDDLRQLVEVSPETDELVWHGKRITVRRLLPLREVSLFINRVMDLCFDQEHEIAIPEAADFAIRLNTLIAYAGIISDADIETQYRVVYESGLYEMLLTKINTAQLEAIRQTVQTCVLHMM